jgi:hypothetical protein
MSSVSAACCCQERQLLAEGVTTWQKNYYMPGTSDTGERSLQTVARLPQLPSACRLIL